MHDLAIGLPPLLLARGAVSVVWLYEGLWCKLLAPDPGQVMVIESVPVLGPRVGRRVLFLLGVVESLIAVWFFTGWLVGLCAVVQTALLVTMNANGVLWARRSIHDPAGMVVKNACFLLLAWTTAALSGAGS